MSELRHGWAMMKGVSSSLGYYNVQCTTQGTNQQDGNLRRLVDLQPARTVPNASAIEGTSYENRPGAKFLPIALHKPEWLTL
jgi:hypothetical protein